VSTKIHTEKGDKLGRDVVNPIRRGIILLRKSEDCRDTWIQETALILDSRNLLDCKLTDAHVKVGDGGSECND
jgi:hypothetical protein